MSDKAPEYKSNRDLVAKCNELARQFYEIDGYEVLEGYEFFNATHPQEVGAWRMAVLAYEFIEGTDIENALCDLEDDE